MKFRLTWRYSALLVLTVIDAVHTTAPVCEAQSNPKTCLFLNRTSQPHKDVHNALELQIWELVRLKKHSGLSVTQKSVLNKSNVVLYQPGTCLARNISEVLHICRYLGSLNLTTTPTLPFNTSPGIMPHQTTPKAFIPTESKSEVWKERFNSLEKFKEQLKDTPSASASDQRTSDSIESDDVGEWINFASSSAGAKIIGVNPETRNAMRVIDGKKETFMKTDCKVDQWLIIELSNVANIKVIELTMKELYSPRIALITVFGRMMNLPKNPIEYPAKFKSQKWTPLVEIEPENRKGTQRFPIQNKHWVKYLGIQVLKYHGLGRACTINDISVFGISPVNNLESLLETAVQEDHSYEDDHHQRDKDSLNQTQKEDDPSEKAFHSDEFMEQCYGALFEDVVMDRGVHSIGKDEETSNIRSSSISTFKKMHQDVQNLKGSSSVLSQYVQELQSSLMKTIDELWESHTETKSSTHHFNEHLTILQSMLEHLERRLDHLEEDTEANSKRLRIWMSILGASVSLVGYFALRSSYFTPRTWILVGVIYILCSLNLLVALINLVSAIHPATINELYRLIRKIPVHWRDLLRV